MKLTLLLGLTLVMVGCGSPGTSSPAPTQQAIQISYPTALQAWADQLSRCAAGNPLIALYFTPNSSNGPGFSGNDITLMLGNPAETTSYSYLSQVGWDDVVVIVNRLNPISRLSGDELSAIFSGVEAHWVNGRPIQVWVLPVGEPTRSIFDQVVLSGQTLTSEAMLAPHVNAVLEAVSKDDTAIGYLTSSALSSADPTLKSQLNLVQLDPSLQEKLHQPVLAQTQSEPKGLMRSLIVCLQTGKP